MRDQPRARGITPFLTAAASLVAASAWVSLPPEPLAPCQVLYIDAGQFAAVSDVLVARISSNLLQLASAVAREG